MQEIQRGKELSRTRNALRSAYDKRPQKSQNAPNRSYTDKTSEMRAFVSVTQGVRLKTYIAPKQLFDAPKKLFGFKTY